MARKRQKVQHVPIDELDLDHRLQFRDGLVQEKIDDYAENLEDLPPARVVTDGTTKWLTGGRHRHAAHVKKNKKTMPCIVRRGTFLDALIEAAGENHENGVHRTRDDQRRAVEALIAEKTENKHKWSNRAIAEMCHVSHTFVNRLIAESRQAKEEDQDQESGNVSTSPHADVEPENGASEDTKNDSVHDSDDTPEAHSSQNGAPEPDAEDESQPQDNPASANEFYDTDVTNRLAEITDILTVRARIHGRTPKFKECWDALSQFEKAWKRLQAEKRG